MELPPGFRIPGVGARKFQSQDRDLGDRSVWTDTPADRERKKLEQLKKKEKQGRKEGGSGSGPAEQPVMSKRDREMEELAAEHNVSRYEWAGLGRVVGGADEVLSCAMQKGRTESLFSVHARKRLVRRLLISKSVPVVLCCNAVCVHTGWTSGGGEEAL